MNGNILDADGAHTTFFGKLKKGKAAGAPDEAHEIALENLERLRAEGVYKSLQSGDVRSKHERLR